jgi:hypothetical protein
MRVNAGAETRQFDHLCDRLAHIRRGLAGQSEHEVDENLVAAFPRQGNRLQDAPVELQ